MNNTRCLSAWSRCIITYLSPAVLLHHMLPLGFIPPNQFYFMWPPPQRSHFLISGFLCVCVCVCLWAACKSVCVCVHYAPPGNILMCINTCSIMWRTFLCWLINMSSRWWIFSFRTATSFSSSAHLKADTWESLYTVKHVSKRCISLLLQDIKVAFP